MMDESHTITLADPILPPRLMATMRVLVSSETVQAVAQQQGETFNGESDGVNVALLKLLQQPLTPRPHADAELVVLDTLQG